MVSKTVQGQGQKFFFDQNIFDENIVEEPEIVIPPPPTFSEQELENARQAAFAEGKKLGIKETHDSIEKHTTQVLDKILHEFTAFRTAEIQREKTYERESLELTLTVFKKLFPLYHKTASFDELLKIISDIFKKQEGHSHILVTVQPNLAESVEKHLNALKAAGHDLKFSVKSDDSLPFASCRLAWSDGGAIRNPEAMAEEIRIHLEQILAKTGPKGHDGKNAEGENQ